MNAGPRSGTSSGRRSTGVMSRGEATWHEDALVPIYRDGELVDVYWTYSYSPVRSPDGAILGTLVTCSDTTTAWWRSGSLRSERRAFAHGALGGKWHRHISVGYPERPGILR